MLDFYLIIYRLTIYFDIDHVKIFILSVFYMLSLNH